MGGRREEVSLAVFAVPVVGFAENRRSVREVLECPKLVDLVTKERIGGRLAGSGKKKATGLPRNLKKPPQHCLRIGFRGTATPIFGG